MPKGQQLSGKFKHRIVQGVKENHLGYAETVSKYGLSGSHERVRKQEHIYLEEGVQALYSLPVEEKLRKPQLNKKIEENLETSSSIQHKHNLA